MPRRPNKTDYGMLDVDADVEAFYKTQMNEEVDAFIKAWEKPTTELPPVLTSEIAKKLGVDLLSIYERGWNDGHLHGVSNGRQQIWFYEERERKAKEVEDGRQ